jgi:hypothetical protein
MNPTDKAFSVGFIHPLGAQKILEIFLTFAAR